MTDEANKKGPESTRRKFLTATTALAGALCGLPGPAEAERKRNPKRGGTLRFGTRDDSIALDTHRNIIYFVSHPLTGITGGLLDFDDKMQPKPAVAIVGRLVRPHDLDVQAPARRGVPQWQTIDAERQRNHRAHQGSQDQSRLHALGPVGRRACHRGRQAHHPVPSQGGPRSSRHQPHLLPGEPHGAGRGRHGRHASGQLRPVQVQVVAAPRRLRAGPLRELLGNRLEGNTLPYLDGSGRTAEEGGPRAPDRAAHGRVDLIDNVAYADAPAFKKDHGRTFDTWNVPQVGTAMMFFNLKNGRCRKRTTPTPTCCGRRSRMPSTTRASTRRCSTASARSPRASTAGQPLALEGHRRLAEVRSRQGQGAAQEGQGRRREVHHHRQRQLPLHAAVRRAVHAMLKDAGFNAVLEILPSPVMPRSRRATPPDSTANSYRLDPDGWYGRTCRPRREPPHRLQERKGRPDHPGGAQGARPGQAQADVRRRRDAGEPRPADALHRTSCR